MELNPAPASLCHFTRQESSAAVVVLTFFFVTAADKFPWLKALLFWRLSRLTTVLPTRMIKGLSYWCLKAVTGRIMFLRADRNLFMKLCYAATWWPIKVFFLGVKKAYLPFICNIHGMWILHWLLPLFFYHVICIWLNSLNSQLPSSANLPLIFCTNWSKKLWPILTQCHLQKEEVTIEFRSVASLFL